MLFLQGEAVGVSKQTVKTVVNNILIQLQWQSSQTSELALSHQNRLLCLTKSHSWMAVFFWGGGVSEHTQLGLIYCTETEEQRCGEQSHHIIIIS